MSTPVAGTAFNLARVVDHNADRRPDVVAVISGDVRLTAADLRRRMHAVAAGLADLGVGRGDVVALLLHNATEFLEASLAVNALGAVFLPLNVRLSPEEWRYIVDHAGAVAVVTDAELLTGAVDVRRQVPALRHLVVVAGPAADRSPRFGDDPARGHGATVGYETIRTAHDGESISIAPVGQEDVARLMYTSGTTARPKGVPLTYGNVLWKTIAHLVEFGITAADRTLIAGPMYHVGGFDLPGTGVLYAGGSLVIVRRFDPAVVMATIAAERPTNLWLAPSMVNAILALEEPGSFDTSSVRFITGGGEKMPVPLIERLLQAFPDVWLADAYGLTETVSGDTLLDREHMFSKIGSVGRPVAHLDLRIVDDRGEEVPADSPGEIVLRGPKVFGGYWKDPAATTAAIVDGWFHTGDVGHLDADGYLFIDDRKKDMIVSGGENVATPEIERVLYEHEAVLEAAVVGVPDDRWGEVPHAVVVLRPGSPATAQELVDFCAARLAKFKVPKRIWFRESLPRSSSGKVLKRELRGSVTP